LVANARGTFHDGRGDLDEIQHKELRTRHETETSTWVSFAHGRALEPVGQINSKISRQYAGTGLGLPLAKRIVELHCGELTIQSEVDVGTTVTVILLPERVLARNSLAQGHRESSGMPPGVSDALGAG
jgi:hypothetical protein